MDTVSFLNHTSSSFVHFSWIMLLQSSLLILILLGLDLLLRQKVRAVFRYCLWMLLLVKLILPVGLALPCSPAYYASGLLPERPVAEVAQATSDRVDISPATISTDTSIPYQPVMETPAAEQLTAPETVALQQPQVSISWQSFVSLGWLIAVLVMLGLLVQRIFFVSSLIRQSTSADENLLSQLKRCALKMNMHREMDLRISPNATSPSVCGLIRPVILIPGNLTGHLNTGQMDAILMHELAHIQRGDLWVNLVQALLQIIYFYNPLLWVANAVIRRVREQAVDERVLVAMDDHAEEYPQTLLNVSKLVWNKPMLSLRLIGVVESKSALTSRIKHILSRPFPKSAKLGLVGLAAIFITAAVLLPMAKGEKAEKSPDSALSGVMSRVLEAKEHGDNLALQLKDGTFVDLEENPTEDTPLLQWARIAGAEGNNVVGINADNLKLVELPCDFEELAVFDERVQFENTMKHKYENWLKEAEKKRDEDWLEQRNWFIGPNLGYPYVTYFLGNDGTEGILEVTKVQDRKIYVRFKTFKRVDETTQNSELKTTNYTATLPNGVTVELLGVCEHPSEGKQWWTPTGHVLAKAPYDHSSWKAYPDEGQKAYEAAIRCLNVSEDNGVGIKFSPEGSGSTSFGTASQTKTSRIYSAAFTQPDNKEQINMTMHVAAGEWADFKRLAPVIKKQPADGIVWHPAKQQGNEVVLHIVHSHTESDFRVMATTKNGKVISSGQTSSKSSGDIADSEFTFSNLKLEDISQFVFQTRPYEWITFKNVSLRPGGKTEGEIETQSSVISPQSSGETKQKVHGYVTDALGRPRGNVYITNSLSNLRGAKRTDQNGRFSFELDDPSQTTWVASSQPIRAVGLFTIPKEYKGQSLHVPLDLTDAMVEGRIVGSDGKGLANRKMELLVTTDQGITYQSQCYGKTDQFGCYDGPIPCGDGLTVQANLADANESEKDYASQKVALKDGQIYVEIPTFVVGQGNPEISDDDGQVHYSGRILNEDKEPIEGVEVGLSYDMPGHMGKWGKKVMTDKQGRWSCRIEKEHSNPSVRLIHPDYLSFHFDQSSRKPAIQELLDGTNVMILKRGHRLTGTIRDPQGEPLGNALVAAGRLYARSPYGEIHEDATTARTTSNGTFTIGGLPEKKIDVMISAANYAPAVKAVEIKQDMKPIEVTLEKGITYTGQVVDVDENPIEGVKIDVGDWRIGNERHSLTRITQTDAQGKFTIDNLPSVGTIRLDFGKRKSGLMGFSKEIPEDLSELDRIAMYKKPVISGKVVDAQTGDPITNFKVINGVRWKNIDNSIDWSRHHKENIQSEDGSFNQPWQGYHISYPFDGACYLKIQADGYLPEATPPVELGKEYEPFVIKLTKAETLRGTIVDKEDNPAANAQVGWVGLEQKAFIINGQFDTSPFTYQTDKIVKTNSQGQFTLQPSKEQGLIVVLHENGYAALASGDFKTGGQIQLTPWATITGVVVPDKSGNTENTISVAPVISKDDYQTEKVRWCFDSVSLSQNNFTIKYVPSIPLHIGKVVRWEQNDSIYLKPQPGQNYDIQIGGKGQMVTGRITAPNTPEGKEIAKAMTDPRQVHAAAFMISPANRVPEEIAGKSHSSFQWLWRNAKSVYPRSTIFHKRFIPTINKNGEFKFENLASGKYEFVVNVHLPLGENVSCGRGVLKGINVVPFDVTGNATETQIPDIELKMLQYPVAGEQAPDFQTKTFEGKTISLKDFRGKVVLLDYWATWCRPCVDQIPELQEIYDTFGADERFEMISLSLDWDVDKAKQMIANKGLQWHQVSLGDMSESLVVKDYGVGAIPALILIDAEGKIIAQNISSDNLKSTIQKALAR